MTAKWFETVDSPSLCRGGGNGPLHPSQLFGLAFINLGNSMLDVGCGSGTTLEILRKTLGDIVKYKGVDFTEKHIKHCKERFPGEEFEVQNAMALNEKDQSWDVVWSRHVVDHLRSFEDAILEHMRVARQRVICILWRPLVDGSEHEIKNIVDGEKVWPDEYTNEYSVEKVMGFLASHTDKWDSRLYERIGYSTHQTDTVIIMERISE